MIERDISWFRYGIFSDLSVRRQTYVEDCEVCCKPIQISYTVEDGAIAEFDARTLE